MHSTDRHQKARAQLQVKIASQRDKLASATKYDAAAHRHAIARGRVSDATGGSGAEQAAIVARDEAIKAADDAGVTADVLAELEAALEAVDAAIASDEAAHAELVRQLATNEYFSAMDEYKDSIDATIRAIARITAASTLMGGGAETMKLAQEVHFPRFEKMSGFGDGVYSTLSGVTIGGSCRFDTAVLEKMRERLNKEATNATS